MHCSIAKDLHCSQVCEIKNCNKCLFFEAKKKQDLYMWWVYDLFYGLKTLRLNWCN